MKSYLIACDLNRPAKDYPGLIDAIKRLPLSWHHFNFAWIVNTDWTARQVRDHIKSHIDPNDQLLVLELTGDGAWAGLNDQAISWLVDNL